MIIEFPNAREVFDKGLPPSRALVFLQHHRDADGIPHSTTAELTLPDGRVINAKALCSPQDQFAYKEGRRICAMRLLKAMRVLGYRREDRKTVFDAICPEFTKAIT